MANNLEYILEWQRKNKDKLRQYRLKWHFENRKRLLPKLREYSRQYRLKKKAQATYDYLYNYYMGNSPSD